MMLRSTWCGWKATCNKPSLSASPGFSVIVPVPKGFAVLVALMLLKTPVLTVTAAE